MREHVAVNRTVMDRSMDNTDRYSAGVLDNPQTEMRNKS